MYTVVWETNIAAVLETAIREKPTREATELELTRLMTIAVDAATKRGHALLWESWTNDGAWASRGTCECGAWVQCETRPAPNSIDIGGPAVAVGCPLRKDLS